MFKYLLKNVKENVIPKKNITPEKQLGNIKDFTMRLIGNEFSHDKNNMHSIFSFIKILSDKIVLDGVCSLIKNYENCYTKEKCTEDASLNTFMSLRYEGKNDYRGLFSISNYQKRIEKEYKIELSTCPVIVVPWEFTRLANAISKFGTYDNEWEEDKINHFSILYLPIGITMLWNGTHSGFCGMLKSQGTITAKEVYDITELYSRIYFDGIYYRQSADDEIICKAPSFEFGCVFEIGRLISHSKIRFMEENKRE